MTKRDVLSIAIKVLGLVFLANAVAAVPSTISFARTPLPEGYNSVMIWGSLVLTFVIGVVLLALANDLARCLVRQDSETLLPEPIRQQRSLFIVAAQMVGLVLIARALPSLVRFYSRPAVVAKLVYGHVSRDSYSQYLLDATVDQWTLMITMVVTLGMGTYLLLGAKQLAGLLHRDQQPAPLEDDSEPTDSQEQCSG